MDIHKNSFFNYRPTLLENITMKYKTAKTTRLLNICDNKGEKCINSENLAEKHKEDVNGFARQEEILFRIRNIEDHGQENSDLNNLIKRICKIFLELDGCHLVWICLMDESGKLLEMNHAGFRSDLTPWIKTNKEGGISPCANMTDTWARMITIEDPGTNTACRKCVMFQKWDNNSVIVIHKEGGTLSSVLYCHITKDTLNKEKRIIINEISHSVNLLLKNRYLEKKLEMNENVLRENKEFIFNVLSNSPNPFFVTDHECRIKYVNPSLEKITGFSSSELIGIKPPFPWWRSIDVEERLRFSKKIISENRSNVEEVIFNTKNGRKLFAEVTVFPLVKTEESDCVLTYWIDITQRKQIEKNLWEYITRNELVLQTAMDGFFMIDCDGKILDANKAAGNILNEKQKHLIGKNIIDFIVPEHKNNFLIQLKEVLVSGPRSFEAMGMSSDKKRLDLEIQGNCLKIENKEMIFTFFRDITVKKLNNFELKQRESELRKKALDLQELNTALKVVLKRVEMDKIETQENVTANINDTIKPYLKKLEEICSTDKQRMYLDLINSDINNITSSFPIKLSSKYLKLTTSELNIANLVKHGKRTKEIAELLNVSCQTIDSHRNSIRKKLGIRNKKVDLRTYLLSM